MELQITRFTHVILQEGEAVVITEIEKGNKLIFPKWLVHQTLGENVKFVEIEKTENGLIVSKSE